MIRRMLLYSWAGIIHVWTLLTIVAFFYFPVFLDTQAVQGAPRNLLPGIAIALAILFGPVQGLIGNSRIRSLLAQRIPVHFFQPFRAILLNLHLWSLFVLWHATGQVVWDTGMAWAGVLYFVYWILAGLAAYSLSMRDTGLGYFTGCAQILEYAKGHSARAETLKTQAHHQFSRHPFSFYMILSLWITPLMTSDRLIWAVIFSACALIGAEISERRRTQDIGKSDKLYKSRVPRWVPLSRGDTSGGGENA